MDAPLSAGAKPVREPFATELGVYEDILNPIVRRGNWIRLRVRKYENFAMSANLKRVLAIIGSNTQYFHSFPSFTSSLSNLSTRAPADPFIACQFSRSHFTTSLQ